MYLSIAGGIVCGAIDAATTKVIGRTAVKVFLPENKSIPGKEFNLVEGNNGFNG